MFSAGITCSLDISNDLTWTIRLGVREVALQESQLFQDFSSVITSLDQVVQILNRIDESSFTQCAYAQGRVKRLSPSRCLFVVKKTRLFAVLPLENHHEIALYRSASQFMFFERCLESRTSLLSSAMAMGF